MDNKIIKIYSDSGHAWARIDRIDLIHLNIIDKISKYSYQKNGYVYLEEDSDLSHYVNALNERFKGININYDEITSTKSKIRSYQYFKMNNEEINDVILKQDISAIKRRLEENRTVNRSDYDLIIFTLNQFLKG